MHLSDSQSHLVGNGAVRILENRLKRHFGMPYAVCVSSATAGLLGVALALDLHGSEFVTTPYTWGGSIAGWLLLGNRPIFVDIEPRTLGIDAESACHGITPHTRALLAVDIFGLPSDMANLRKLADEYGLVYVADAAQSFGALRDGLPASSRADVVVVSFGPGKTLDAGEGGAVVTKHAHIYERLIWHTQHCHRQRCELGLHLDNEFALNARIHPWAAAEANVRFDAALRAVDFRRQHCYQLIQMLNSVDAAEHIALPDKSIEPAFSRLTAIWRSRPKPALVASAIGGGVDIVPAPVRLLYRQPAFLSQYGPSLSSPPVCPEAERQVRRRFELVIKDPRERSFWAEA